VERTVGISKNQRIISKHDKVSAEQAKILAALEESRRALGASERAAVVVFTRERSCGSCFLVCSSARISSSSGAVSTATWAVHRSHAVFMLFLVCAAIVLRAG